MIIQAQSEALITFPFVAAGNQTLPYTLALKQKGTLLDTISQNISLLPLPLIESTVRQFGAFTGSSLELTIPPLAKESDPSLSRISFHVAQTPLVNAQKTFASLIAYPYGCIEQTIASTLPNAIALKFANLLGTPLDTKKAQENLDAGLAKILRMQYLGGWKYWEEDSLANPYITPYVIRSLKIFEKLGVTAPQSSKDAGLAYLSDMVDYRSDLLAQDINLRAEVYATLAENAHPKTELLRTSLETDFKNPSYLQSGLPPHAYLLYAYGLFYEKKLTADVEKYLEFLMNKPFDRDYWYWNHTSDLGMYAQFLIDTGKTDKATTLIDTLLRAKDLSSYFVSTQEKIQMLLALISLLEKNTPNGPQDIALRSGAIIADLTLGSGFESQGFVTTRDKIDTSLKINRTGKGRLFYEVVLKDIPKDILLAPEKKSGGMEVRRTFEKIDESK